MSLFLEEVRTSFESKTYFTVEEALEAAKTVSDEDLEEVQALRDETEESLPHPGDEVEDIKLLGSKLEQVNEETGLVKTVDPINAEPVIELANNNLNELGKIVGLEAPQYKLDKETHTVDELSMESVTKWIGDVFSSFIEGIKSFFRRIGVFFSRMRTTTKSIEKRINKVSRLVGRRKSPEGGNVIKISDKYSKWLVNGTNLTTDHESTLLTLMDKIDQVSDVYFTYGDVRLGELGGMLAKVMSMKCISKIKHLTENDYLKVTDNLVKSIKGSGIYPGNIQFTVESGKKGGLISVSLRETQPNPKFIINNLGGVKSLSNEQLNTLMVAINKVVSERIHNFESKYWEFDTRVNELLGALSRFIRESESNIHRNIPQKGDGVLLGGVKLVTATTSAYESFNGQELFNQMEQDLDSTWVSLYGLLEYLLNVVSSYVALAEESVLRD